MPKHMHSSRMLDYLLRRCAASLALLCFACAAPPALATATGTLTTTFDNVTSQTVALNGESLLVIAVTINYTNGGNADYVTIKDTLPAGMVVAPAADQPSLQSTCMPTHSTFTATPGSRTIFYSWYDYNRPRIDFSCRLRIMVKAVQAGVWVNAAQAKSSSDHIGGIGVTLNASATLNVLGPPTLTRSLQGLVAGTTDGTQWAIPGQPLNVHYTITNPNPALALTGVGFTETLPSGVVSSSSAVIDNDCTDGSGATGTVVALAGSIMLSQVHLAAASSCSLTVSVVPDAGSYTLSTAPSATETGTGSTVATSFQAFSAPQRQLTFTDPTSASIAVGASATLTLALTNSTSVDVGGVGFTATLPSGLVIADSATSACGGSVVTTAATGALVVSGALVPANTACDIAFHVLGVQAGEQNIVDGALSVHGAPVDANMAAGVRVNGPPSATLAFNPASVAFGSVATLNVALTNPAANPDALSGVAITVALPAGLNVVDGSSNICGGTLTTTAASRTLALTDASIGATQCQFGVSVMASAAGNYALVSSTPISANGGSGVQASANFSVNKVATTTTLASACMTTFVGIQPAQPFTVTAAVSGTDPTGSVSFTDNVAGTLCAGNVTLNGGTATCTTTALVVGAHQLSASYHPDGNHLASMATPLAVTVLDPSDAVFRDGFEAATLTCPIE